MCKSIFAYRDNATSTNLKSNFQQCVLTTSSSTNNIQTYFHIDQNYL